MKLSRVNSILIIISGLFLMFLGIYREESARVLENAVRICLECIGVG